MSYDLYSSHILDAKEENVRRLAKYLGIKDSNYSVYDILKIFISQKIVVKRRRH